MIRCLLLALLCFPLMAFAVIETYQFDDEELRERYQRFTHELRCPKCQNQNLSGSNSPIAEDLRRELHRLLHEGQSDQQITEFMVARYGEFVLYRPRLQKETLVLWLAPAIFLSLGVILVIVFLRRQSTTNVEPQNDEGDVLTESEQQAIDKLLNKGSQDD